jgi:hypothetical protein
MGIHQEAAVGRRQARPRLAVEADDAGAIVVGLQEAGLTRGPRHRGELREIALGVDAEPHAAAGLADGELAAGVAVNDLRPAVPSPARVCHIPLDRSIGE